jgi:hypothetical protein
MLRSIFDKAEGAPIKDTLAFLQKSLASLQGLLLPGTGSNTSTRAHEEEGFTIVSHLEEANMEDVSIRFLSTYSTHTTWSKTVSLANDYGQTLAHVSVVFGFLRLLRHLVFWGIDLQVRDNRGLTALHYAYLFQQKECIFFLLRSSANRFVLDHLGRTPSDLGPQLDMELRLSPLDSCVDDNSDTWSSHHHQVTDYDIDMLEEAEKLNLNAKYLLIQRWILQVENSHYQESFPSRRKVYDISKDTGSLPALPIIDPYSPRGKVP